MNVRQLLRRWHTRRPSPARKAARLRVEPLAGRVLPTTGLTAFPNPNLTIVDPTVVVSDSAGDDRITIDSGTQIGIFRRDVRVTVRDTQGNVLSQTTYHPWSSSGLIVRGLGGNDQLIEGRQGTGADRRPDSPGPDTRTCRRMTPRNCLAAGRARPYSRPISAAICSSSPKPASESAKRLG